MRPAFVAQGVRTSSDDLMNAQAKLLPWIGLVLALVSRSPWTVSWAEAAAPKAEAPVTSQKMNAPTPVTPAEAEALLAGSRALVVIDVRTQEEFAEGHIPGAQNVNFQSPTFLEKMKAFTGKTVLIHCASGGRSGRALEVLRGVAFDKLYHLNEGFQAWQAAGKPVTR
ncbi:MAG: hypothetical protein RLZZ142_580 [Verrucomicrobiota bacterium]